MIELQKVTFGYPSHSGPPRKVFEEFDLTIPQGRYVALMGPNGSGKSTLGKLIKGLLAPSSGQVLLHGSVLPPGHISFQVGYLFSNPQNQIVSSVVEEDVAFGLENMSFDPRLIVEKVRESLRWVEMEGYARHSPHLLSGGQLQKVVLAGILAMECSILVLDEPTSMLDLKDREEILDLLQKIHGEGERTILHITHAFEEASRAQDLLWLDQGRLSFQGTWEDFFGQKNLLDSSPFTLPPVWQLAQGLRDRGHAVPHTVRSLEDLQRFLLTTYCPSPAPPRDSP